MAIEISYDQDHEPLGRVFGEVFTEITKQDVRWGVQDHPWLGDGAQSKEQRQDDASYYKSVNDANHAAEHDNWSDVLNEEVVEAIAEDAGPELEAELVQVAAVAIQAVMSLRRQAAAKSPQD